MNGRVCRFCGKGISNWEIAIRSPLTKRFIYICDECHDQSQKHGIDLCEHCGNVYLRNDGCYQIVLIEKCEVCDEKKILKS